MRVTIITLLLSIANARNIEQDCNGVIINNVNHKKEVIKDNVDSPYQLAIDYDTNTLYFSYTTPGGQNIFESAYLNLKTNTFKIIPGINGGFANAVDPKRHVVYLGGRDGIYKFNFETEQAEHIKGIDDNIWQLFYKDELYFTDYPKETAYVFIDGEKRKVPELDGTRALVMALDRNNNFYYSNSTGLFTYERAKGHASFLGDYNVNGITADISGNLFFSTPTAIYSIDDKNQYVKKLTNLNEVYGLAIEADGSIIYASQTSIVKLIPTQHNCYINEKENLN